MKATLNGQTIAEAGKDDLIYIEGNWYFPLSSVKEGVYEKSDTPYNCPWKGECQYYDVKVGDFVAKDAMFGYPQAKQSAIDKVKKDFRGHVAFWQDIVVSE